MYAAVLPLLDITKATAPKSIKGTRYEHIPKILLKKDAMAPPINPPNPKLLIKIKILIASVIQIFISSANAFFGFC
jgi:hypothetical protein